MVDEIDEKEFEGLMKKKLVLIDFFAEWCMPCVMMSPILDEVAGKLKGKAEFAKVNVDENQEIAEKFGVMSIPTLILFSEGKEIDRISGALPADVLEARVKKAVK